MYSWDTLPPIRSSAEPEGKQAAWARGERILEAAPSAPDDSRHPSPVLALGRTKIRRRGSTWRGAVLVAPLGAAQAHAGPSRASVARAAASSSMRSLSSLAAA